jgi:hypothetical protein
VHVYGFYGSSSTSSKKISRPCWLSASSIKSFYNTSVNIAHAMMSLQRIPLQTFTNATNLQPVPGVAGYRKTQSGMSAFSNCHANDNVIEDSQETCLNSPPQVVDAAEFLLVDLPLDESQEGESVPGTFEECRPEYGQRHNQPYLMADSIAVSSINSPTEWDGLSPDVVLKCG